jgi:hypothetical protein
MSAEWSTMAGFLPPSSRVTGVRWRAADATAAGKEDVVPALLKQGVGDGRAAFGYDDGARIQVGRQ